MLINLLSTSNQCSFNIEVAKVFGLASAVYISEIININEKALRKNKVEEGYFVVDRDYVTSRTTLKADEQYNIDNQFNSLKIIEIDTNNKNRITLNIETLTSVLLTDDEKLIKELHTVVSPKRRTKKQVITDNLKDSIKTTNTELRNAYCEWIDAVMQSKSLTKSAVKQAENFIENLNCRNLDAALYIINYSAAHAYIDLQWGLQNYNQLYHTNIQLNTVSNNNVATVDDINRCIEEF